MPLITPRGQGKSVEDLLRGGERPGFLAHSQAVGLSSVGGCRRRPGRGDAQEGKAREAGEWGARGGRGVPVWGQGALFSAPIMLMLMWGRGGETEWVR